MCNDSYWEWLCSLHTSYMHPGTVSDESSPCATIHWASSCASFHACAYKHRVVFVYMPIRVCPLVWSSLSAICCHNHVLHTSGSAPLLRLELLDPYLNSRTACPMTSQALKPVADTWPLLQMLASVSSGAQDLVMKPLVWVWVPSAGLGGSRKYSNQNFENWRGEGFHVRSTWTWVSRSWEQGMLERKRMKQICLGNIK